MPLPAARAVYAKPADPKRPLLLPTGRLFPAAGRLVDTHDPFYALLIADRSLVVTDPPADAAPADAAPPPPPPSATPPADTPPATGPSAPTGKAVPAA